MMDIKVTLRSGRVFEFEVTSENDPEKFMNQISKSKFIRIGKLIINVSEIETIETK